MSGSVHRFLALNWVVLCVCFRYRDEGCVGFVISSLLSATTFAESEAKRVHLSEEIGKVYKNAVVRVKTKCGSGRSIVAGTILMSRRKESGIRTACAMCPTARTTFPMIPMIISDNGNDDAVAKYRGPLHCVAEGFGQWPVWGMLISDGS